MQNGTQTNLQLQKKLEAIFNWKKMIHWVTDPGWTR